MPSSKMSKKSSSGSKITLYNNENAYIPEVEDLGCLIRVEESLRKIVPKEEWTEKNLDSTNIESSTP